MEPAEVTYKCFYCDVQRTDYDEMLEHLVTHDEEQQLLHDDPIDSSFNEEAEAATPKQSQDCSSTENLRWTPQETMLLIRLVEAHYEKFNSQLKKNVWKQIASDFSKMRNKHFDGGQCDSKFKALKAMYKKIYDHNTKHTGNDRKVWEYYEAMHKLLYHKPEINPPATCSSTSGITMKQSTEEASGSVDASKFESTFMKKRKAANERTNARVEQHHKDKMARQDEFLSVFKDFVNTVKKQQQ